MWRAERLKAGVGSRSKAASPAPSHPRLLPCCERMVSERCSIRVEGGVRSCLHGNPITWCNRCRPACHALVSPCFSKLTPPTPPPPLTVLCVAECPRGAKRLSEPDGTLTDSALFGIRAISPSEVMKALRVCFPESPLTPGVHGLQELSTSLLHDVFLLQWTAVEWKRLCAVFRLLVVAAWLLCSAEILPPSCSLDNACRSRLLPVCYCIYLSTEST